MYKPTVGFSFEKDINHVNIFYGFKTAQMLDISLLQALPFVSQTIFLNLLSIFMNDNYYK